MFPLHYNFKYFKYLYCNNFKYRRLLEPLLKIIYSFNKKRSQLNLGFFPPQSFESEICLQMCSEFWSSHVTLIFFCTSGNRTTDLFTLASPTLGNVSMVITVSSPVWFFSCPFRIRAAVYVVIPIPETRNTHTHIHTHICIVYYSFACLSALIPLSAHCWWHRGDKKDQHLFYE